jgi:hypothetical protein
MEYLKMKARFLSALSSREWENDTLGKTWKNCLPDCLNEYVRLRQIFINLCHSIQGFALKFQISFSQSFDNDPVNGRRFG